MRRQVLLHEQLARLRWPLVVGRSQQGAQDGSRDRVALLGQLQRRRDHLLEAHRAVLLQRREPGVGGGRHDGPEYAHRDFAAGVPAEVLDRGRARPAPQSADGHHRVGCREVDDDGRDAAEVGAGRAHDVQRDARGHARVDGVAALREDSEARRGGEMVPRGHHVGGAHDGRPVAFRRRCHDHLLDCQWSSGQVTSRTWDGPRSSQQTSTYALSPTIRPRPNCLPKITTRARGAPSSEPSKGHGP